MKFERNHFAVSGLLAVLMAGPLLGGCSTYVGGLSDFNLKDQEWFQRPGKIFGNRSLAIETPPLTSDKPITQDDLMSAEGACPGAAPTGPTDANAQDNSQAAGAPVAPVALGHIECDVVRSIGTPTSVNLSRNARGERLVTATYLQGPRAGIYTFTAGRLSSVERVNQPAPAKPAKKPAKKRNTT